MGKRKTSPPNQTQGKSQKIASTLRKAIVAGKYKPGQQLPTRVILERKYKVSPETLQRSFDELKADGFLRAQRRGGTFVVDFPPHLHRYGLALGSKLDDPGYPQFFKVLAEQAQAMDGQDHASIPVYLGVADKVENQGITDLTYDLKHQRLAGVIYCGFVPERFKSATIPQILISNTRHKAQDFSLLAMSTDQYVRKAVSYFATQGCKRLGVVGIVGWERKALGALIETCREAGLAFEDQWFQSVSLTEPQTARRITHLMMHADNRRRPDALLIADDNIIAYVKGGLVDAGVTARKDVCVIAHANFPSPSDDTWPMRRLGYDARQVIRSGQQLIDHLQAPDARTQISLIEPYFEDELI